MAGTKISALTAGAALGGTEAIPAVQSAATVKITAAQIKTFTSASPTLVTPVLGVATGTSLALGGATIGTDLIGAGVSKFRVDANGATYVPTGNNGGYYFGTSTLGIYSRLATGKIAMYAGGDMLELGADVLQAKSTLVHAWSSGVIGASNDTGLSRISAGVIGVGTGAQGSTAGSLRAASLNVVDNAGSFTLGSGFDTILTRPAAATLQHGAADAASPVAQTVKFQDVVAGTSNTAGVNATIQAPAGTGTGAGGSLIFQVAPAGSSGSAKNAWATALTIDSAKTVTFNGQVIVSTLRVNNLNNNNNTRTFLTFSGAADTAIFGTGMTAPIFQFGGTTSSFPALKRSTTSLQVRLADDSAFTAIQGKLTTDTAYTAGDPTTTGYLVVYDSTGTAYRVPALLN